MRPTPWVPRAVTKSSVVPRSAPGAPPPAAEEDGAPPRDSDVLLAAARARVEEGRR